MHPSLEPLEPRDCPATWADLPWVQVLPGRFTVRALPGHATDPTIAILSRDESGAGYVIAVGQANDARHEVTLTPVPFAVGGSLPTLEVDYVSGGIRVFSLDAAGTLSEWAPGDAAPHTIFAAGSPLPGYTVPEYLVPPPVQYADMPGPGVPAIDVSPLSSEEITASVGDIMDWRATEARMVVAWMVGGDVVYLASDDGGATWGPAQRTTLADAFWSIDRQGTPPDAFDAPGQSAPVVAQKPPDVSDNGGSVAPVSVERAPQAAVPVSSLPAADAVFAGPSVVEFLRHQSGI